MDWGLIKEKAKLLGSRLKEKFVDNWTQFMCIRQEGTNLHNIVSKKTNNVVYCSDIASRMSELGIEYKKMEVGFFRLLKNNLKVVLLNNANM